MSDFNILGPVLRSGVFQQFCGFERRLRGLSLRGKLSAVPLEDEEEQEVCEGEVDDSGSSGSYGRGGRDWGLM